MYTLIICPFCNHQENISSDCVNQFDQLDTSLHELKQLLQF